MSCFLKNYLMLEVNLELKYTNLFVESKGVIKNNENWMFIRFNMLFY